MRSFLSLRNPGSDPHKAIPFLEELESRLAPYAVSGNAWPAPQLITISFVPDGTTLGANAQGLIYSNLFSMLNTQIGATATWENAILKAAQSWAQQTNINFSVVSDNGAGWGTGSYQQGDPGFGDIRISGYNFNQSILGSTGMPPPVNNFSGAGDISFNTGEWFGVNGRGFDLYTVASHEIGHALGLYHSNNMYAMMYGNYNGRKLSLGSDDVAGIRNIYSSNNPRSYDAYYGASQPNNSFANAADVSSAITSPSLTATLTGLDMTTTSEVQYFKFTAPANNSGSLTVNVQSTGLSLLTPKMTVYAADQTTVLGTATGTGEVGNTLSVTVNGVTTGQQFYVKVQGADTTAFSTGAYAMTLNLGTGPSPTVPLPNTTLANGYPIHVGGGEPESSGPAPGDGAATSPASATPTASPAGPAATSPFAALDASFRLLGLSTDGHFATPSASLPGSPAAIADAGIFGFGGSRSGGISFGTVLRSGSNLLGEDEAATDAETSGEEALDWADVPASYRYEPASA